MQPLEIRLHRRSGRLELVWEDIRGELSAEYLRVFSPSAEVQGHVPGQQTLQHGKKQVAIRDLQPQGHYAIRIVFSDGHDTGIFSWQYLRELHDKQAENWQDYEARLAAAGQSREPRFIATDASNT